MQGAQISLSVGLVGVLLSLIIGVVLGGISGYYGGRIDFVDPARHRVRAVAADASRSGSRWRRRCRRTGRRRCNIS